MYTNLLYIKKNILPFIISVLCFTVIITLSISAILLTNVLRKDISVKEVAVGNAVSMINTVQLNDDYIWPVNPEDADIFTDSEFIRKYNKVYSFNNIAFYPADFEAVIKNPEMFYSDDYINIHTYGENLDVISYGQIAGITDSEYFDYFSSGGYTLISGDHFSTENSGEKIVLISDELAKLNNLSVGDSITIELCSYEKQSFPKHSSLEDINPELELKVCGIFTHNARELSTMVPAEDPDNLLFIPYDTVENWIGMEKTFGLNSVSVYLENKDDIESFLEECKEKLPIDYIVDSVTNKPLWSAEEIHDFGYTLQVDSRRYLMVNAPVESASGIVIWFSIIINVCGLVILLLLTVINVNKRTGEIGLRLALGQKKSTIIRLIITENIVPVMIASLVAIAFSAPIASEFAEISMKPTSMLTEAKNEAINYEFLDYLESAGVQKDNASSYSMDFFRRGVNAVVTNNNISIKADIPLQTGIAVLFIAVTVLVSSILLLSLLRLTPMALIRRRR